MARPDDWRPLADTDPVPGDTAVIRDEVRRMRQVASTIRAQVDRLRKIGQDGSLCGRYAEKLRTEAGDLAGKLEKTAGRYEKVSGHLDMWANDLDHAQSESVIALNMAKPAQQVLDRTYISASPPKKVEDMTPAERQAHDRRENEEKQASAELEAARTKLRSATRFRDEAEGRVARWIRESIDDDVEDSAWDNVKDFVDKHANTIKVILDVASWVATGLAIIAMFVPGLNLIVLGLTAFVVAGRILLAATGNASWMEVLIDAVGLLTFGVGKAGTAMLKGANKATKALATTAARTQKAQNLARTGAARRELGKVLNSRTASAAQKRAARSRIEALKRSARNGVPRVPQNLPKADGKLARVLNQNDTEGLALLRNVNRISDRFPGAIPAGVRAKAYAGYGLTWGSATVGTLGDYADKGFGSSDMWQSKWNSKGYSDWKSETWKAPVGSTW